FEKFQTPAVYLAKNPVLAAFAHGKSTGLIVDSGAAVTCVTAVHDGYALTQSIVKSNFAGEAMTDELLKNLQQRNITVRPRYSIQKKKMQDGTFKVNIVDYPNTTQSYQDFCVKVNTSWRLFMKFRKLLMILNIIY